MSFVRPQSSAKLSPTEKRQLLQAHYAEYRCWAAQDSAQLNLKLPGGAFARVLDQVGELLLHEAVALARKPGDVLRFLDENPLPQDSAVATA